MKKFVFLIFVIMVLLLCSCGSKNPSYSPNTSDNQSGGILSSFETTTLNNKKADESILKDYDLTMVNVWATFCGPCINEMPDLGALSNEYKNNGVQIIGLVSDVLDYDGSISQSQINTANSIVATTKANYIHLVPSGNLLGVVSQITSVPTTFFVDKNGNQVGGVYVGSKTKEAWKTIIDQTLGEVVK